MVNATSPDTTRDDPVGRPCSRSVSTETISTGNARPSDAASMSTSENCIVKMKLSDPVCARTWSLDPEAIFVIVVFNSMANAIFSSKIQTPDLLFSKLITEGSENMKLDIREVLKLVLPYINKYKPVSHGILNMLVHRTRNFLTFLIEIYYGENLAIY